MPLRTKTATYLLSHTARYGTRWMTAAGSAEGPAVAESPEPRLTHDGVC